MDRLTSNPCGKKAGCRLEKNKNAECCYAGCVNFQRIMDRLAAYEDISLTPEEIRQLVAEGTMDEEAVAALSRKEEGQDALMVALKARIQKVRGGSGC